MISIFNVVYCSDALGGVVAVDSLSNGDVLRLVVMDDVVEEGGTRRQAEGKTEGEGGYR